uniref:LIM zinc-binding domain-containing protein n=1 Tax=Sinocyclocheilus anshuiensis TaxID=1608454 RepID=A0A671ST50_9TELE
MGGSDVCYFCGRRVYVMERLSAEGKFFHRSCFQCDHCSSTLRLSNYTYDHKMPFKHFFKNRNQNIKKFQVIGSYRSQDSNTSSLKKRGSIQTDFKQWYK